MGGQKIDCPLCCEKTFDSKELLLEHLAHITENLYCSICSSKCTSIEDLTEHLSLYDCQSVQNGSIQNIVIYEQSMEDDIENATDIKISDVKTIPDVSELNTTNANTSFITEHTYEAHDDTGDVSKMYVELLSKQLSKPILQTQELKLISENGESRYMIVTQDDSELSEDSAVVTKQNHDGTISLTTVKDMKLETDTLIAPEPDSGNSQEEIYSCNACKVSFTSVIDHIQNFHNDQEVVLEDIPSAVPPNFEALDVDEETPSGDKQTPRRVITDNGDIVEEPVIFKPENTDIQQDTIDAIIKHPKLVLDKQGRAYTRRYVQIDKVVASGATDPMSLDQVKYPCPRCPASYENSKSLCAHMKVHKMKPDGTPGVPISYECEVCCTVFPTNKSLKLHKRMHDPIKVRPIEPPENFDGTVTGEMYRCDICDKLIPKGYRAIHDNSHTTTDKMNCSICNKKFSSRNYLEMHMNVHNLDKVSVNKQDKTLPYKCLYCNRRFGKPHEKVKHERIHTGEKPHSCEICGKSFRVSYCLTLHMRTHTGARPYACVHCGKRFKAHSVYNHHLLTHSEVRAYKCPYCPKAFKTSVQLAGHKNSHTKPFSCQHCNRPFASLYAVRVHTETHSRQNNLKFSCALCGASYARAFALKDHVKQVHKQDVDTGDNMPNNNPEDDDWNTNDAEGIQSLNKELQGEISDLGMDTNE